jgi:hypothetical protein
VHDLLVDRNAHRGRKAAIALEGRARAPAGDEALDFGVDVERGHARLDELAEPIHEVGQDVAGPAHQVDLSGRFALDPAHGAGQPPRA